MRGALEQADPAIRCMRGTLVQAASCQGTEEGRIRAGCGGGPGAGGLQWAGDGACRGSPSPPRPQPALALDETSAVAPACFCRMQARKKVLRQLGYLDDQGVVTLKVCGCVVGLAGGGGVGGGVWPGVGGVCGGV